MFGTKIVVFHEESLLLCQSHKEIYGRHREINLLVATTGSVGKTFVAEITGL
jgi:hypothetical protein